MPSNVSRVLTIPVLAFIQRIARYEFHNMPEAADALRQLASECRPVYHVDEVAVLAHVVYLQGLADNPPLMD